jgi:hypothetical protein
LCLKKSEADITVLSGSHRSSGRSERLCSQQSIRFGSVRFWKPSTIRNCNKPRIFSIQNSIKPEILAIQISQSKISSNVFADVRSPKPIIPPQADHCQHSSSRPSFAGQEGSQPGPRDPHCPARPTAHLADTPPIPSRQPHCPTRRAQAPDTPRRLQGPQLSTLGPHAPIGLQIPPWSLTCPIRRHTPPMRVRDPSTLVQCLDIHSTDSNDSRQNQMIPNAFAGTTSVCNRLILTIDSMALNVSRRPLDHEEATRSNTTPAFRDFAWGFLLIFCEAGACPHQTADVWRSGSQMRKQNFWEFYVYRHIG